MSEAAPKMQSAKPPRSTFVTAVGWTFILLGGACVLVAALDFAVPGASPPRWTRAPMVFRPTLLLQSTPALFWTLLLLCAALLLAGVGLVLRREWGRRLSLLVLGAAIAALAVACLCLVDAIAALHIPYYRPSSVDRTLTLTAGLITAAVLVAACALAAWIAWRLTRQRHKREFEANPAGDGPQPVDRS